MAVRIVAVDDEPGIRCLLESIINELSYAELVGQADSAAAAFDVVRSVNPDVVFLDIDLPDSNGIQLAERLKEYDPNLYIVFITAHSQFSLHAYRLYAYDYIIKPIDENRVKTTVRRIQQLLKPFTNSKQDDGKTRLAIRQDDEILLIDCRTIYYIEKIQRKTVIYTSDGIYDTVESLNELEDQLGDKFFRSHKSYLINIKMVDRIVSNERVSSYQVKFKGYPYEALLSRNRVADLLRIIKS